MQKKYNISEEKPTLILEETDFKNINMTNYFISTTIIASPKTLDIKGFASLYDAFFYFSSEKKNKSEKI